MIDTRQLAANFVPDVRNLAPEIRRDFESARAARQRADT